MEKLISPVLAFEQLMAESDSRAVELNANDIDTIEASGRPAIAEPLDDWCEFCTTKLATMKTVDGVAACAECAGQVIAAMEKYSQEMVEAGEYPLAVIDKDGTTVLAVNIIREPHFGSNRTERRRARRKLRLRNNGAPYGG